MADRYIDKVCYCYSPNFPGFTTPILWRRSIRLASFMASYSFCSSVITSKGEGRGGSTNPETGLILQFYERLSLSAVG